MVLRLVDGTYELFRSFYGAPPSRAPDGREVGATRGFLRSMLSLIRESETTHCAVAFDHEIESFRNELFDGYKTGEGIDPDLFAQFPLVERAADALGMVVWPMVEFEADDAIATAARLYKHEFARVDMCSPDKDLAQCVQGEHIVMLDRRKRLTIDEAGVREKFGVGPRSIPDYLALVGDDADGIPGVPRWGKKSAATVLAHYETLEAIPDDPEAWDVKVRGAKGLAANLAGMREEAALYKKLATLRFDVPLKESVDDLKWQGAKRNELAALCDELGETGLLERVPAWR